MPHGGDTFTTTSTCLDDEDNIGLRKNTLKH